jgi:hypothetical protein
MYQKNVLIAAGTATALFVLAVASVFGVGPEKICNAIDGKWSPVTGSCTTRSCFKSGDCGRWAYPSARCSRLKLGDKRAEVYFQLGNPDDVFAEGAKWQAGKDSAELIVATFREERLLKLSCPSN